MKNLFLGSLRNQRMLINIVTAIVFVSVITFVLYEGTKKSVALDANGEQLEISTHAKTVADVLADQNITVADYDKVSPSLKTEIVNGLAIQWEQAKEVVITVDDKDTKIWTTEKQVKDILQEANIAVTEHDKISLALDKEIDDSNKIAIEKAFALTIVDGLDNKKVWSTAVTIKDLLAANNITLNEFDRLSAKDSDVVQAGSVVKVTRVVKATEVKDENIDFEVTTEEDSSLTKGQEKVISEGEQGTVKRTYEIVKENGEVVATNLLEEEVTKEAKNKVVAIGTKEVVTASRGGDGSAPAGGTEFYVTATAYTPYCYGCSGISAAGIDLRSNPGLRLIAVDPNVIPLGSRVWVEGYGYAVAGDTGGAIKGNIIDLLVQSESEANAWGRRQVRIKVL